MPMIFCLSLCLCASRRFSHAILKLVRPLTFEHLHVHVGREIRPWKCGLQRNTEGLHKCLREGRPAGLQSAGAHGQVGKEM